MARSTPSGLCCFGMGAWIRTMTKCLEGNCAILYTTPTVLAAIAGIEPATR